MYSTFHGLEIGKRAILSQQTALSTTGHNIANANTKGYTRQEAVLEATRPLSSPSPHNGTIPMQMGTGVEVSEFRRFRENYLDRQFQNEQQNAGYWEAKAKSLSQLENVFNGLSDSGLSNTLNRFWQGLQELAKQPENISTRVVVAANGKEVADQFNQLYTGIADYEKSLTEQLSAKTTEMNRIAREIASLNQQIGQRIGTGSHPNDLLDRRDVLLDQLSKLASLDVKVTENGKIDVSIGGVKLISGNTVSEFAVNPTSGEGKIDDNVVELTGGEIKGLLETHGYTKADGTTAGTISELKAKLDLLAKTIAANINAIHAGDEARNLDDIRAGSADLNAPLDKLLFFVDKDDPTQPPTSASNMIVNPILISSPSKIAAAKSNQIGDGSNAALMSDVFTKKIDIGTENMTIADYYKQLIGQLGTDVQTATQFSDNAHVMVSMIDNQRQSVSGVSLDEEMTNMIRFQQAYNAAARYVSAVNDLLNTIINGIK